MNHIEPMLEPTTDQGTGKEQGQVEEALRESRHLYSSLVENMPAGVFRKNKEGRYIFVNQKYCQLRGLTADEVLGKTPQELATYEAEKETSGWDARAPRPYTPVELGAHHHEQILHTGKTVVQEEIYPQPDGTLQYYQVIKTPIFGAQGQVVGSQGMQFDITDRMLMEQELIRAKEKAEESDRLKTAFLHNISHEIRSPMNAIVGFAELMSDQQLTTDKRRQYAEIITKSSHQLLSIVADIMSIATIESGQEKVTEATVNLEEICSLLQQQFLAKAQKQQVRLTHNASLSGEEALILTDGIKLTQVLTNLISNALKFTKKGSIEYGCSSNGTFLEFYVKDTGIGIPSEMLDEIFKRFRQVEHTATREYGGSGLGLSISKSYIELMGGQMWVTSQLGKGSEFRFTIPYKKAQNATT